MLKRIFGLVEDRINTKGAERHRDDINEPLEAQPIMEISRRLRYNVAGAPLFQAVKKIYESGKLDRSAAKNELLDAIVYIVAAIKLLEECSTS